MSESVNTAIPTKIKNNRSKKPSVKKDASTDLQQMIAIAAYYRAENRDFQNGSPVEDWLEAEQDIIRSNGTAI